MQSTQPENEPFETPSSQAEEDYLADTKPRRVKAAPTPVDEELVQTTAVQDQSAQLPFPQAAEQTAPPADSLAEAGVQEASEALADSLTETAQVEVEASPSLPAAEAESEATSVSSFEPVAGLTADGEVEPFETDPLADTGRTRVSAPAADSAAEAEQAGIDPSAAPASREAAGQVISAEVLYGETSAWPGPASQPQAAPPGAKPTGRAPAKKKGSTGKTGRKARKRSNLTWLLLPMLGVAALLIVALISAFSGYASGIGQRRDAASTLMAEQADQQFQLGLQDMAQGNYFRARQRFEYVIQLNPDYPGATQKLAEALMFLNATATPTLQPTATLTPTPDVRNQEDLFNQAQQAILGSQWDQAIEAMLALRQIDPTYRPVEIDGLLFLALRNRGREKIVKADLEGGIYDLNLANEFGPLDAEAKGLLSWSELYITGASFWDLDWPQAISYFEQVAPQMPNLTDSSGMTANERLRRALFEYGNSLARQGKACQAGQMYQKSLAVAPNPEVSQALEQAIAACDKGKPAPETTPAPGAP